MTRFNPTSDRWVLEKTRSGGMTGELDALLPELISRNVIPPELYSTAKSQCLKIGYFSMNGWTIYYATEAGESSVELSTLGSGDRQKISKAIRYDLLRASNFKCQTCGISASDAPLEIDHIQPVSMGGISDLSNYQVLCRDCNRGKGVRS